MGVGCARFHACGPRRWHDDATQPAAKGVAVAREVRFVGAVPDRETPSLPERRGGDVSDAGPPDPAAHVSESDTPGSRVLAFHLSSLAVVAGVLVWSARGLQFYWDDWALVAALSRGDFSAAWFFGNHNEHWIMLPKLVYALLYRCSGSGRSGRTSPSRSPCTFSSATCCGGSRFAVVPIPGSRPWSHRVRGLCGGCRGHPLPDPDGADGSLVLGALIMLELVGTRPRGRWSSPCRC